MGTNEYHEWNIALKHALRHFDVQAFLDLMLFDVAVYNVVEEAMAHHFSLGFPAIIYQHGDRLLMAKSPEAQLLLEEMGFAPLWSPLADSVEENK